VIEPVDPATIGLGFAVVSSFMLGANKLAVRKSLFKMDESFASLIAILLAIPLFGIPILVVGWGPKPLTWEVVVIFSIAGILNYSVGRYFVWKSISMIGANRANVVASTQVVYAVLIAILLLGQTVDVFGGAGIALVLVGIFFISFGDLVSSPLGQGVKRRGIVWGALGAFLWGISQVLMQVGISLYSNATTATFLISVVSLFGMLPVLLAARWYQERSPFRMDRKSLTMVVVAGLLANFGLYFRFTALQNTTLTIVASVNATNPLITLVLSYALIRELEFINRRTVIAILVSVVGVVLMSL
jgi:drug/metabolite transporter (DMT)-like permease